MGTFFRIGLLVLIAGWFGSTPALAEKRVALVIGNGAYTHAPQLPNPPHDADDVAAALKRSNFDVIFAADAGQTDMQEATIRFARSAANADVALFYYSGHAMQYNGVNYLMPVDAKLDYEADLKRFARVDDILNDLQQAEEPAHPGARLLPRQSAGREAEAIDWSDPRRVDPSRPSEDGSPAWHHHLVLDPGRTDR